MYITFVVLALIFAFWALFIEAYANLGLTFAVCAVAVAIAANKPKPKV